MKKRLLPILAMFCMIVNSVWADGFTVERAVNLGQLDSWTDISKFQWQEIDHGVLDNREEMDALKEDAVLRPITKGYRRFLQPDLQGTRQPVYRAATG